MAQVSMLSLIDWRKVSRTAEREQTNREKHAPVVSVYRWWARRPHSVMGAILDAAGSVFGSRFKVADPFSGGGTVTIEAVRRGLQAYAQDLYPWPAGGLAAALSTAKTEELTQASQELLAALEHHRVKYTGATGAELSHVLRVRSVSCPHCNERYYLFPESMVSVVSRSAKERQAFFGCSSCGSVTVGKQEAKRYSCKECGKSHKVRSFSNEQCPHCDEPVDIKEAIRADINWKPVLVQELQFISNKLCTRLRAVQPGDPVVQEPAQPAIPQLQVPIKKGIETKRLLDAGYKAWGELYTFRQAQILVDALSTIPKLKCSDAVKDRLAYAVIGAAEMPAYLSRWDRFHLKAFEGLANHRYASTAFAVEVNPLSPIGRGTLPRRFLAAQKALAWLSENCEALPEIQRVGGWKRRPNTADAEVVVATGSSARQALSDHSVQLVLTDPPYFDDVQYGELARLFHAWLSAYKPLPAYDEMDEAVPNQSRGTTADFYESAIAKCLKESRRTLAPRGRLVLTFHNKKLAAWESLAGAIAKAGFYVKAIAVVRAENAADHCKRNVASILHDLVIECAPASTRKTPVQIAISPKSSAEKNLVAMGVALAEAVSRSDSSILQELYQRELKKLRAARSLIA